MKRMAASIVSLSLAAMVAAGCGTHEFRGNDETLKDLKVGDRLELTLRQPPR